MYRNSRYSHEYHELLGETCQFFLRQSLADMCACSQHKIVSLHKFCQPTSVALNPRFY